MNHDQTQYGDNFAAQYDRLMSGKKYAAWESLIAETVERYAVPRGRALDVACGTGTISRMLEGMGFSPLGIDLSGPMLEKARGKSPSGVYVLADMRDFDLSEYGAVDLAVCFYDSLNYLLTDEDMLSAFRSVRRNMKPDGIFLFDMNTRDHIAASQKNKPRIFEDETSFVTFRFGGRDRVWTMDVDMFLRRPDGAFAHDHELHTERGYDETDILPMLETAGFMNLETKLETKVYEDGLEHPSRLYFTARAA